MIYTQVKKIFAGNESRVVFYFLLYTICYSLIHLVLISVFSFFHFLLNHDLGTINNWLSLNGWEIIAFSKTVSAFILIKFLKFNTYEPIAFWKIILGEKQNPSKKIFVISFFILSVFYALIQQFGGGIKNNILLENLVLSSSIGSILFFGVDIVVMLYFARFFDFEFSKQKDVSLTILLFITGILILNVTIQSILPNLSVFMKNSLVEISPVLIKQALGISYIISFYTILKLLRGKVYLSEFVFAMSFLLIFVISSRIILPYLEKYLLFIVVHFIFLYFLLTQQKILDIAVYLVLIVSFMSVFFGIDLVWDNNYSMFVYDKNIPLIGVVGIWAIALKYYKVSKLN